MRKPMTIAVLATGLFASLAVLTQSPAQAQAAPPNCSPILPVEFNSTINEGQTINIQVGQSPGCADPRITDKVFINDGLPLGLRIDRTTGRITGTVGVQQFNPTNWTIRLITTFQDRGQTLTWEASDSTTTVMGTTAATPTVTPEPTRAPQPTTPPRPTVAPTSTPRPAPTATPRPTVAPAPTPSPTATPRPAPTATPIPDRAPEPTPTSTPNVGNPTDGGPGAEVPDDTDDTPGGRPPTDDNLLGSFTASDRGVWFWIETDGALRPGTNETITIVFEPALNDTGEPPTAEPSEIYVRLQTESDAEIRDPDQWVTVPVDQRVETEWTVRPRSDQDVVLDVSVESDTGSWAGTPTTLSVMPSRRDELSDWFVANSLLSFLIGLGLAAIVVIIVGLARRRQIASEAPPPSAHDRSSNPFQY